MTVFSGGIMNEEVLPFYLDGHHTGLPVRVPAIRVPDANNPDVLNYGCVECVASFSTESFLVAHFMQCHRGLQ